VNDMEMVRDFCAEEERPGPQELAAVRAKVMTGFGGAPPGRARQRIPVPCGLGRPRLGRPRLGRPRLARPKLALAGAAAATTAAAVIAAVVVPSGAAAPTAPHGTGGVQLDAAVVLHHAAQAALSAPIPGKNGYVYAEITGGSGYGTVLPSRWNGIKTKEWFSITGTRPNVIQGVPSCLGQGAHGSGCPPDRAWKLRPLGFTYTALEKLPTTPTALLDYIYGWQTRACQAYRSVLPAWPSRAELEWSGILLILNESPVLPPRFGAALFDAAAQIRGGSVIDHVKDAAGRTGIAVVNTGRVTAHSFLYRSYLIFDPHTYQYIGSYVIGGFQDQRGIAVLSRGFVSTAPTGIPLRGALGFMGAAPVVTPESCLWLNG